MISDSSDSTSQAEFPEITLCRDKGGYKEEVLALNGVEKKADYSGNNFHGS